MKNSTFIINVFLLITNLYASETVKQISFNQKVDKSFFIENKGQWPEEVLFKADLPAHTVWITKYGVVYDLFQYEKKEISITVHPFEDERKWIRKGHVYKMIFENASKNSTYEGRNKTDAYFNFFIGQDKSKHQTNVKAYREVFIRNQYNGIDVRYYIENNRLRFDFIVAPNANPGQILIKFEGLNKTSVENKAILLGTRFGNLQLSGLYVYQGDKNNAVQSSFYEIKANLFGIKLKNYNYSLPLIIDPVTLLWSTYLGGSAKQDFAYDIAVDGSENVYVTGETSSNNFPVSVGAYDNSYNNNTDVFVTKLNPTATSIIFSTYIGGGAQDKAYGIDIDNSQNIYVVGTVSGGGFPYTPGAMITTWKGSFDGFALKLNNAGNNLLYATGVAGGTHENCTDVMVDYSTGNVFITGYTRSSDFPHSTTGVYQTSINGYDDAYIIELNATGTALVRGTFFGGNGSDFGNSLKRDNTGYIYLLGRTNGIISTTSGCYQNTLSGGWDLFICKLSSNLSTLLYSTYLGGSANEDTYYNSLDIDTTGNVYVTGYTESTNFPITSGVLQTSKNPSNDAFVSKLQLNGLGSSDLIYSTYLGGNGDDQGRSVVVFDNGSVFVTGYANSNFYATVDAYQPTNPLNQDVFLIWLSADFSTPLYSTYFGGDNAEESYSLKHDAVYNVYICGTSYSSNFPTTTGVIQTSYAGIRDAFVAKFSTSFNPLPIELIYFKAEVTDNNYVRLDWETATELNNDYFTVERSKNGFDFEQVLTRKGAGNSNHSIKYTAYDYSPYQGISYYRLKQTDFDGQYEYSEIVVVNINKINEYLVTVYPNPTNNQIIIEGNEYELQQIKVYNLIGQDVTNQVIITAKSLQIKVIDLSKLATGTYYIKTKTTANKVYKQ